MSAGHAADPLLAAEVVTLERGGRELFHKLSFEVLPGQLIQIEGPNGAGKTSLLRILAGLSRYGYQGSVAQHVPLLFLGHHAAVKALLTPRENLAWHVAGEGVYSNAQIEDALARVGLYGYEDVPSHALSAGQHRRVNLARLYLSQCRLWLLDEPFTAIDKSGVTSLESLLVEHVQRGGAVVMTSHQLLQVKYKVHMLSLASGVLL